jgi:hypothetical protein
MCDYSLMSHPSRLAIEGEELVAHRFLGWTVGLVSPHDLRLASNPRPLQSKNCWSVLCEMFEPPRSRRMPVVCIPPGSRLLVRDIPEELQSDLNVGRIEEVTFTQISAAPYSYRDAIRFRNGRQITLQRLEEGQRIRVLDLSVADFVDSASVLLEQAG